MLEFILVVWGCMYLPQSLHRLICWNDVWECAIFMDITHYLTDTLLHTFNPYFLPKCCHKLLFQPAESKDTLIMPQIRCEISGCMSVFCAKYVDIRKICSWIWCLFKILNAGQTYLDSELFELVFNLQNQYHVLFLWITEPRVSNHTTFIAQFRLIMISLHSIFSLYLQKMIKLFVKCTKIWISYS